VREVVFAALRAVCWRPRACPPFLAAAVRFEEERVLEPDERELDEERLRALDDERLLDERVPPERLDPLDFLLPPEPPLLRLSAISPPPSPARSVFWVIPRNAD
jgi:hypothetical protein